MDAWQPAIDRHKSLMRCARLLLVSVFLVISCKVNQQCLPGDAQCNPLGVAFLLYSDVCSYHYSMVTSSTHVDQFRREIQYQASLGNHASPTATAFGSVPNTGNDWAGSVLAPNGKIYGIPYSQTTVLI